MHAQALFVARTSALPAAQNNRLQTRRCSANRRHRPSRRTTQPALLSYGAGSVGSTLTTATGEPLLHVVFVAPQIHWNTGNIGRTCVGLGARLHLVRPLGFSLDEKQIRRAGLDYWSHVDIQTHENWAVFLADTETIDAHRFYYTKFGTRPAAKMEWPADRRPVMLVFGSEIDGFDSIRSWVDDHVPPQQTVAFPMLHPEFRSFNLSTSASMVSSTHIPPLSRLPRSALLD